MKTITLENAEDFLVYRPGSGDTVEIFDIAVGTERGIGRGRRLVGMLICSLRREQPDTKLVWAIARSDNLIAQQFYEAIGFRVVGVLRDFYKDTPGCVRLADAIVYGRDL